MITVPTLCPLGGYHRCWKWAQWGQVCGCRPLTASQSRSLCFPTFSTSLVEGSGLRQLPAIHRSAAPSPLEWVYWESVCNQTTLQACGARPPSVLHRRAQGLGRSAQDAEAKCRCWLEPCRGGLAKASCPAVPPGPGWGKERSDRLCSLRAHFKASVFSTESELQEKLEVALGGRREWLRHGRVYRLIPCRLWNSVRSCIPHVPCHSLHCSATLRVMRCHG